jgi:hypothetical protein
MTGNSQPATSQTAGPVQPVQPAAQTQETGPSPQVVTQEAGPTSLTGSGSDKPLQIANQQAKTRKAQHSEFMLGLHEFLLQTAGVDLDLYPSGPVNDMQEALLQYTKYNEVLEVFKPWLKKKKGYLVPYSEIPQ